MLKNAKFLKKWINYLYSYWVSSKKVVVPMIWWYNLKKSQFPLPLLLDSIYQEPYIIWLPFMLHICKMIISPKILIFRVFSEVKGQNSVCRAPYFRNHTWYDVICEHLCKPIISPAVFFVFSLFWFYRLLVGQKGK